MGSIAFAVLLWIIALVGIVQARTLEGVGGWIPLGAATLFFVLSSMVIVVDTRTWLRSRRPPELSTRADARTASATDPTGAAGTAGSTATAVEAEVSDDGDMYTAGQALAYVAVAMALYFGFGPAISVGLSLLVFLRSYGRRTWAHSVIVGSVASIVMYLLIRFLKLAHYEGLLWNSLFGF